MHRTRILHCLLALLTLIGVGSVLCLFPAGPAGALGGADSTITSTTDPSSVVSGQPVALEVTVSGSDGTPTGTVTFTAPNPTDSADYTLCVATLQSGSGSCTATNLTAEPAASNPPTTDVTANYSGDDNYSTNRGSLFVNVSFAPTSIALQSSPNPNLPDTVFTVTANVTVNSPGAYTDVEQGNVYVQFQISGYDNPYSGTTCNGPLDVSSTPMTSTCSFNFPAGLVHRHRSTRERSTRRRCISHRPPEPDRVGSAPAARLLVGRIRWWHLHVRICPVLRVNGQSHVATPGRRHHADR